MQNAKQRCHLMLLNSGYGKNKKEAYSAKNVAVTIKLIATAALILLVPRSVRLKLFFMILKCIKLVIPSLLTQELGVVALLYDLAVRENYNIIGVLNC